MNKVLNICHEYKSKNGDYIGWRWNDESCVSTEPLKIYWTNKMSQSPHLIYIYKDNIITKVIFRLNSKSYNTYDRNFSSIEECNRFLKIKGFE